MTVHRNITNTSEEVIDELTKKIKFYNLITQFKHFEINKPLSIKQKNLIFI